MKYGLFVYEESHNGLINIGDYIQSLAARQFLADKDFEYIERDQLNNYTGENMKLIMNGWFTHRPENWPPSSRISPLFISYHLNKSVANQMMNDKDTVDYFKSKSPIGCRDYDSVERMKSAGIDAYYTGCLTTTLNYNGHIFEPTIFKRKNKIILVDVLYKDNLSLSYKRNKLYVLRDILKGRVLDYNKVNKYINNLVPVKFKENTSNITCYYTAKSTHNQRFSHAEDILRKLAEAKVVVTSRIHIALPCLALGTPVLFALGGRLANKEEFRRLDGIVNLMNVLVSDDVDVNVPHLKGLKIMKADDIDWENPPENPQDYLMIRNELIKKVERFMREDKF